MKDANHEKIISILAQNLGVETDDIKNDDSFFDNLHMTPSDLTDFVQALSQEGFDISKLDLTTIDTVSDLLEALEQ